MKRVIPAVVVAVLLSRSVMAAEPVGLRVGFGKAGAGDFPLVEDRVAADLVVDSGDSKVVQIAAGLLSGDVQAVTGVKPRVRVSGTATGGTPVLQTVFIGTLGHSPAVDAIIKAKGIDVSAIVGKWESYEIVAVANPVPGVEKGLLIIGSDRRGTAYGVFEVSEKIGVSPWNWWADVPAAKHESLAVSGEKAVVHGPPSVKYRGIFINDEDWGMQPWAAKTFEPETKDIGPKTYAKIFELLLRLDANFCWPAMHDVTKAFNIYPANKQVADDYGIVMGSSHCEPMLRNNVSEWVDAQGKVGQAGATGFNWVTNSAGILDYWTKRLAENGKFENVYTLGLRGIHDGDMAGGGTAAQKATRLNEIIKDQRSLLEKFVNPDVSKVPQIFCPYKEVLTYYHAGAVPPDDVTLVWADDNHGYIRQLSTPAEQKRAGGAGVYYHLSYWGAPHDYLWLESTPPALIWEELSKAYDYNARNLWVINVGDLKPAEIGITLSMQMAYDAKRYGVETIGHFLPEFAAGVFGTEHAAAISEVMGRYYQLNYQRKPEHMGFNTSQNPGGPVQGTEFSDGEIAERLVAFEALVKQTNVIYEELPNEQKDAFFELVAYPVRGSALQNQKILYQDLNRRAAVRGDAAEAKADAEKSTAAYEQIQVETAYYNDTLAGGKWKDIMSANPHNQDVFRAPKFAAVAANVTPGPEAAAKNSGYVSIAAEHFTRNVAQGGAAWKVIPGLGRMGDSVAVFPPTTASVDPMGLAGKTPELEYDFVADSGSAAAALTVEAIPTHRINPARGLRYAVAIDGETPKVVDLETPENSVAWSTNVLRGSAFGVTQHAILAGKHTLHLYMVDPGVVVDHITIDLGGLPKGYLPPRERGGAARAGMP